MCSADAWLRETLNQRETLALDPSALADLIALVRPSSVVAGSLLSPLELAASIDTDASAASAAVWDTIVQIEKDQLEDRALLRKARAFRDAWLARRATEGDVDMAAEWGRFRATGSLAER